MSKHPSKQKGARKQKRAWLAAIASLLLVWTCAGQLQDSLAQTPRPAQQQGTTTPPQQRPRRVGSIPAPTPNAPRATPTPAPQEVDEDEVVRVETQLVTVPVTVTDRTGRTLTNLRAENFALYEDGRPQRVANFIATDAPFEVALLLDTSGSTRAEVGLIRRAANAFIDALRP
ncbi:MAG TPA: hypothetical protein VF527_14705, partial [Pyrinomonadaceae bacterium]